MKNISISSLIFTLTLASATSLLYSDEIERQKECMAGIPLEVLRAMYAEKLKEVEPSQAYQKKEVRQKQFDAKYAEYSKAMNRCHAYNNSYFGELLGHGNAQDCSQAQELKKELLRAGDALQYSKKQLSETQKDFLDLYTCIHEREYNELVVTQD